MKFIVLYKNRGVATVDDADYEWLSQYNWHIDKGYAAMTVKKPKKGIVYMHRLINMTPEGLSTDHVSGDKLDNRRANLRTCNQSQNNANARTRKDNSSGHRGVVWHKKDQKWQAQITINRVNKYLGQFKDKTEAITAYKLAALTEFGEFANVDL